MTLPRRDLEALVAPAGSSRPDIAWPTPPEWMASALCAQVGGDLHFPEQGGSAKQAKALCAACPVAAACLEMALTDHLRHGIYGGCTDRERQRMRRCPHCGDPSAPHGLYCGPECRAAARREREAA